MQIYFVTSGSYSIVVPGIVMNTSSIKGRKNNIMNSAFIAPFLGNGDIRGKRRGHI